MWAHFTCVVQNNLFRSSCKILYSDDCIKKKLGPNIDVGGTPFETDSLIASLKSHFLLLRSCFLSINLLLST